MAPLTTEELHTLESTLLPARERHHLRLLAHGLRTLQVIAGRRSGPLPDRVAIAAWARSQPVIADDPAFAGAFLEQLDQLGRTLQRISSETAAQGEISAGQVSTGSGPLGLGLEDLVGWSLSQADDRLGTRQR
ncbi:MAG: hypothetical protein VKI83_00610 [Synechococcaceae cyanobacterium]|nr:hypothetical protein [Synechococcaceae cyanobacterium]